MKIRLHEKATFPLHTRKLEHFAATVFCNMKIELWTLIVHGARSTFVWSAHLPRLSAWALTSRAVVFTPLPLFCSAISLNFCDGQRDESVQEVPRYRPEPATSSFIGFCESPSQTLDQTTSISSKKPLRWCWRTSAHQRSAPFKDTGR